MAILPKGSEVPTIVEGAEEGATFQVEVSAHLMSLLAGLYSKREDSIVREVLCNAYDAQKSIGVTAPVVIEAPSALSPVLKIRDKGPGMSKIKDITLV
jgi:HSP90 family molecular chaperone